MRYRPRSSPSLVSTRGNLSNVTLQRRFWYASLQPDALKFALQVSCVSCLSAMASPKLRWGVVGTGWIAEMFVTDILAPRTDGVVEHVLSAVGSTSSVEKSNKFIDSYWKGNGSRPKALGSYQEVYDDAEVDIIYIATPHSLHKQNCLDAIRAGKHILCEKPFTINAREAEEVIDAAKAKGVFLMEGERSHSRLCV